MKSIFFLIGFCVLFASICFAEDCKFKYWEVISSEKKCEVYHLPDFDFQAVEKSPDAPEHIKRFCKSYKITSKHGRQRTGYCYTGEGDIFGPTFRLGDENWNFSSSTKDKVFFADLNFSGCYRDADTHGIVFGNYGWKEAPTFIQRSWPMEKRIAKCKGR